MTPEELPLNPKELVLFAGFGGSSIGDKHAGFQVEWLLEKTAASLGRTHPKAMIFNDDITLFFDKCEHPCWACTCFCKVSYGDVSWQEEG